MSDQSKTENRPRSLSQYVFSITFVIAPDIDYDYEVVYVTIGNLAFYLALYLTGVQFRGKLDHILVTWVSKKSSVDQSELEK